MICKITKSAQTEIYVQKIIFFSVEREFFCQRNNEKNIYFFHTHRRQRLCLERATHYRCRIKSLLWINNMAGWNCQVITTLTINYFLPCINKNSSFFIFYKHERKRTEGKITKIFGSVIYHEAAAAAVEKNNNRVHTAASVVEKKIMREIMPFSRNPIKNSL